MFNGNVTNKDTKIINKVKPTKNNKFCFTFEKEDQNISRKLNVFFIFVIKINF